MTDNYQESHAPAGVIPYENMSPSELAEEAERLRATIEAERDGVPEEDDVPEDDEDEAKPFVAEGFAPVHQVVRPLYVEPEPTRDYAPTTNDKWAAFHRAMRDA